MSIRPANQYHGRDGEVFADFTSIFKVEVSSWLDSQVQEFIRDYLAIKNSHKQYGIHSLYDYSFLLTPAFKALEGTLIQIGKNLKLEPEKYNFKIGVVFNDENLDKFYTDVLDKIKDISEDYKIDIQMWLNDAKRILRHYRHSPAHFLGEPKKNWEETFLLGDNIIRIINEMCYTLIKSQIFNKIQSL